MEGKSFVPEGLPPEDLTKSFAGLRAGNGRAAVVVGGSLLEWSLEQAIAARLRKLSENQKKSCFFRQLSVR
jgi:hypothetical protein